MNSQSFHRSVKLRGGFTRNMTADEGPNRHWFVLVRLQNLQADVPLP